MFLQTGGSVDCTIVDFYHRFRENVKTDSTGLETLGTLLEIDNWETFQADWERFVMTLKF